MKKYLLFIVEGINDKREIQTMIRAVTNKQFSDYYVDSYCIKGGDITSDYNTNEKNIIRKLNEIVIGWRNGGEPPFQRISVSDVERIIHIVDTDGAFVPESAVVETDDAKVQYHDDKICSIDRTGILNRNRKKAGVLKKLIATKQIDNIPYTVYFSSCNMDHLLFDLRNSDQSTKKTNSQIFSIRCDSEDYLRETVYCPGICAKSFTEAWDMIQQDYNSLHRHTNINIVLDVIRHLVGQE